MIELQTALSENNIPFRIGDDGSIIYPIVYGGAVNKIIDEIDKNRAREIGNKYEHKISTEYLRALLDENGINYRTETRDGEDWTYWRLENKEQEEEISMKVVNHFFDYEGKRRFGE